MDREVLSAGLHPRLGSAVGACEDARVKLSGSTWFGYGVVVVVTSVVGFLAFAVWVLSKVF
jgi:hypothetical protein